MFSTTTLPHDPLSAALIPGAADPSAARNWAANLRALGGTQPRLVEQVQALPARVEWVFGRDGYLTAREANAWWSGCSLPLAAARYMLRNMELPAYVACLLNPAHAAQIRFVLDRMERPQALIALVPDARALRIMLACDDFSQEIAGHRLWFAWGEAWESELERLFEENPGLATPSQFVRPISVDMAHADGLVGPAQRVFATETTRRAALVRSTRESWNRQKVRRVCLVAPSHFRLWEDAGFALRHALCNPAENHDLEIVPFDPDEPITSSPVALARSASACDAIVTPNTGRADLPDIVPDAMPWITWVTIPRIPAFARAGARDALLVADPAWKKLATDAGWPAERVEVARWPMACIANGQHAGIAEGELPSSGFLALICDTRPLTAPERVTEFSSHGLLWEAIRDELLADPFVLQDAEAYLHQRMRPLQIAADGFDRALFLDGLIAPAFQQGICRAIKQAGLPVRAIGKGWDQIDEIRAVASGPVRTRDQLSNVAQRAAALIHPMHATHAHPIDAMGRPVVRVRSGREAFLREAKAALAGKAPGSTKNEAALNRSVLTQMLHRC